METDDMASKLFLDWMGKKVHPSASGRAWIWRRSMEVLRLERHYTGLPQRTTLNVSVEYSRAQIGEKQYLMPRTVRAWTTVAGSGRQETSEYVATYADYRKFDVATDITYQ
jgi:hypothetical protein